MNMPKLLKDFRLFLNGEDTGITTEEITLPKISYKTESVQGGFMENEVKLGLQKMESDITFKSHFKELFIELGLLNETTGQTLIFKGFQENSQGDSDAIKVIMRGSFVEIDLGSVKRAESYALKVKLSVSSFVYSLNDIPFMLIEPETNSLIINGVDQLASRNKALGI